VEPPIILCGLGRVGWRVLESLQAAGMPVVVIDTHCPSDDQRLGKARLVRGDCRRREILEEAGVASARGVIILTSDDLVNISTALMVRSLHADVRIVLRMFNQNLIQRLGKAVRNVFALSTSTLTAPLLALTALTGQALGAFRLEGWTPSRRQIAEVVVGPDSALRGQAIASTTARYEAVALAYCPSNGDGHYRNDIDPQTPLSEGDRLIICGEPRAIAPLLADRAEGDSSLRWAGFVRRHLRILWRGLSEIDLSVKICTSVLLVVIVLSSLVLWNGVTRYTLPDALFRTVGLLASREDMHEDDYKFGWVKVFVSLLRVTGTVLTAAFTAIVTNYLLRARLGGALEVRRIPESGHVIVCGLGNIGYRIVEELLGSGERVVVIETSRDNRFVATTRRLGVPVIIGDATVREVLRQSHAAKARAVVAATNNDLINLEIGLLVRDLNPDQRVVLRLSDPYLAETLREAANVRLALSVPTLVAPAFVAALYGDRVLGVCLIEHRLFAAINLRVGPQDAGLVGHAVRAVAVNYRLVPVALTTAAGQHHSRPGDQLLGPGDELVGIIALPDLEQLLRREPTPAEWAVDVLSFPLPMREWVVRQLMAQNGTSVAEAEKAVDTLPICLASGLTRGHAEDLLARMTRQRVNGRIRQMGKDMSETK
jgi:Trk K+ transport system NAD-binding subunit